MMLVPQECIARRLMHVLTGDFNAMIINILTNLLINWFNCC